MSQPMQCARRHGGCVRWPRGSPSRAAWRPARTARSSIPTIRSRRIVDSQDASGVQERGHRSALRHARELVLLARRSDAECPGAERQHGRRSAGLELVHEPAGRRAVTVDEVVEGPGIRQRAGAGRLDGDRRPRTTASRPGLRCATPQARCGSSSSTRRAIRAMATGTEVVVTKLFWALGYHVPEIHLATLRPDRADDRRAARAITPPSGNEAAAQDVGYSRPAAQGASRR